MKEVIANLWDFPADYRCITTNGIVGRRGLVMGAGNAKEAKERFPHLPNKLARWVELYGNRVFVCQKELLITFPTKGDWQKPSIPSLISNSVKQLLEVVDKFAITSVVLPRPGCGNGGLDWSDVRPLLAEHLDDRFTVVTNGTVSNTNCQQVNR